MKKINVNSCSEDLPSCSCECSRPLIAEKNFLNFSRCNGTFYRRDGQIRKFWCGIFARFHVLKLLKSVHFCLSYSRNNRVAFFDRSVVRYVCPTVCGLLHLVKAKFNYASWFGAGSKLARSWFGAGSKLVRIA